MSMHTPEYPHVAAQTDIAPLNGDGVEAAYVKAVTKLGDTEAEVVVYWADDENGTPRLIVDVVGEGAEYVKVTVNDGTVFEGKPETAKCPVCAEEGYETSEECTFCNDEGVKLVTLKPHTLFRFKGSEQVYEYLGDLAGDFAVQVREYHPHRMISPSVVTPGNVLVDPV